MAKIASGSLRVKLDIMEGETAQGGGSQTSLLAHILDYAVTFANGTADGEIDRVYSVSSTLTTAPTDVDLAGGQTSPLSGSAITMVDLVGYVIENRGTVNILLGGDAAGVPIFSATNDVHVLPPGITVWFASGAGVPITATTGDIIQLVAASGTCACRAFFFGRSA